MPRASTGREWISGSIIIKPTVDAPTALEEVRAKYEEVLADYINA